MDGFLRRYNCRNVLEVACGTGRLTTLLEDNGYEVTGLDISQDMLDIAKERCAGVLLKQDMRDIRVERPFDALLCLGGSFGYILTDEDVDKAFQNFKLSLRKGGILILDIFDAERTRQHQFGEWRRDVFEFEDMTITRLSRSSDYRERDSTWLMEWEYRIEDGERQVVRDQARLRSFNQEQLKGLLERYGFRITSTIKGRMLILQAEKV